MSNQTEKRYQGKDSLHTFRELAQGTQHLKVAITESFGNPFLGEDGVGNRSRIELRAILAEMGECTLEFNSPDRVD